MTFDTIKFIATDMDGTLLDQNSQLDPHFFELYKQLKNKDILFAAASGRQYFSLLDTFSPIKEEIIFIAENGTLVMHKDEVLYSCTIDKNEVSEIIHQVRQIEDAHLVLCGKKGAYIETDDPAALKEFAKYYHRCERVADVLAVDDEFIKIAVCHFSGTEQHVYPSLSERFGSSHKVVVSGEIWLDVMNAVASKGAAIERLQERFGFRYDESMAFGDYFNDVEMLEACYYSYAVDNAHEEIKKLARFQTSSNKDKGVFKVLEAVCA